MKVTIWNTTVIVKFQSYFNTPLWWKSESQSVSLVHPNDTIIIVRLKHCIKLGNLTTVTILLRAEPWFDILFWKANYKSHHALIAWNLVMVSSIPHGEKVSFSVPELGDSIWFLFLHQRERGRTSLASWGIFPTVSHVLPSNQLQMISFWNLKQFAERS